MNRKKKIFYHGEWKKYVTHMVNLQWEETVDVKVDHWWLQTNQRLYNAQYYAEDNHWVF